MTLAAIALAVVNLIWIGLLPRTFFRRGRLNVQWWLNSAPFWTAAVVLLSALVGVISPQVPADVEVASAAVSIGLSLAALALVAATRATHRRPLALWRQVDDTPEHLVTDGPYAYVRHPFYSSFLLTLAASALAVPHWLTLVAFAYGVHRLNATARIEEDRFLASAFGEQYQAYRRRTGRFVPRVGRAWGNHVSYLKRM